MDINEFFSVAKLLNHDPKELVSGKEICTHFQVANEYQLQQIMCRADERQKHTRSGVFFDGIGSRRNLGQGIHDRFEAALFTSIPFSTQQRDVDGVNRHRPFHVKALSVLKKTLSAGQIWDLTVDRSIWNVNEHEDLLVVVNIAELILEPGSALCIQGNIFSLLCQSVEKRHSGNAGNASDGSDSDIRILPTPFSVDFSRRGDTDGGNGSDGSDGSNGGNAREVTPASSILGYYLLGDIADSKSGGGSGTEGLMGKAGECGRNGGMCKTAEITIRSLAGGEKLSLFSRAGTGGTGGDGGNGGAGGNGGNGRNGHILVNGLVSAGCGGDGGNGGDGGPGGNGGNGGVGSNLFVNVPFENEPQILIESLPGIPGKGGCGGAPGSGGKSGFSGNLNGVKGASDGLDGTGGLPGKPGKNGRLRPASTVYLNEVKKSYSMTEIQYSFLLNKQS